METVSKRARKVSQPKGGYINPKLFDVVQFEDFKLLEIDKNFSPSIIGTAVDYLTRFMLGVSKDDAFEIPIRGAINVGEWDQCLDLLEWIDGLDDSSIVAACQLTGYDIAYRQGKAAYQKPVSEICPNKATISNIRLMVNRGLDFWSKYGPITECGFVVKSDTARYISAGDGDFLTTDTLWDFKVLSSDPTTVHTLQILIYYLMGIHSEQFRKFEKIKRLGIFNPRLNRAYLLNIDVIPNDVIENILTEVIGY